MRMADLVTERGTCPRLHVGAVAVRDGRIICIGYNGSPPGMPHCDDVGCDLVLDTCTRAVHAEANLVAYAARKGIALEGCTTYVTDSPCERCAHLLVSVKTRRLVYRTPYRIRSGLELLERANVEVVQHGSQRGD